MKGISKTVHSTRSTALGGAPRVLAGALLALASLTAGAAPRFVEVAASAGVDFTHDNGMQGELWMVEVMGSGVGVLDFDGDGWLDLWLVQGGPLRERSGSLPGDRLFRNVSNGEALRFTDVTEDAGVVATGYGMGIATGDIDNDGDLDVFLANYGENQCYENLGDGRFKDITATVGFTGDDFSVSASFADINGDGLAELYVANYLEYTLAKHKICHHDDGYRDYCGPQSYPPTSDRLYRNLDGQRFADVSRSAGIEGDHGAAFGVVAGDFNADGRTDFYVANDLFSANGEVSLIDAQRRAGDEHPLRQRNQLWLNDGKGNYEEAEGPAVYARLGELYLAKKEYEKAVEHLTHALALEPAINQLHYPLGLAYRGLGNRELAMHHMSLRGTVKVQPADPLQEKLASLLRGYRGHVTEGRLALTAGRYEKAATSFRKAIDEDPTRATVCRLLAQTDLQLERPEEALANLKEALRLDPEDLIAHALIGDVFIDLGESDKAIIHLKKFARANQQDATVTYKLAWALANNGRFEESIDYYEKSLALDPTRAVIWLEFITMLKNMSDHKLALAKSVLAAEKLPGEPTILANLVLAYAHSPDKQVRDGEKAVEVAKRLYHMESDFETARLVAISYAENDQCDKAVEWIDKTISMAKASMQGDFDLLIQACFRIEWQSQA